MANTAKRPLILYSCYARKSSEGEQFIPEHTLGFIIAGKTEIFVGGKLHVFSAGDFRFLRRNQLARYAKIPPPGGEFQSISITMDQQLLRTLSEAYNLHMERPNPEICGLKLEPHVLLKNFVNSLKPYLGDGAGFSEILMDLKVREAVMILLETNPALKDVLFDFAEPGKIDLEAYMNANYRFNVDIGRFAYLTGRSLATFKRDFLKVFHTTPSRWLQLKRLSDAHYLIKEKGWRSSDVYMEVGFKDFSHFSFAFKKTYGISPSSL